MAIIMHTALAHNQGKVMEGILLTAPTTNKMFTRIWTDGGLLIFSRNSPPYLDTEDREDGDVQAGDRQALPQPPGVDTGGGQVPTMKDPVLIG